MYTETFVAFAQQETRQSYRHPIPLLVSLVLVPYIASDLLNFPIAWLFHAEHHFDWCIMLPVQMINPIFYQMCKFTILVVAVADLYFSCKTCMDCDTELLLIMSNHGTVGCGLVRVQCICLCYVGLRSDDVEANMRRSTRSGRLLLQPLAFWANERLIVPHRRGTSAQLVIGNQSFDVFSDAARVMSLS